jgi:hypothetical protein
MMSLVGTGMSERTWLLVLFGKKVKDIPIFLGWTAFSWSGPREGEVVSY